MRRRACPADPANRRCPEPARRSGRGDLGSRSRVARHRRQDERAAESRKSGDRHRFRRSEGCATGLYRHIQPQGGRGGRQGGQDLRPQGGKTVAFVGTAAAANASERREGFFDGAGDGFRVSPEKDALEVFEDGTDKTRAQTNVQTAISKYPDAGVFLGLWSYNAHFIAEELAKFPDLRKKTTDRHVRPGRAAVDDLAKGAIDVTVCQNPYQMGYLGVRLLKAYIDKDQKTIDEMLPGSIDSIDTGVRVIVPTKDSPVKGENVIDINEMKKWLESKGLKSS